MKKKKNLADYFRREHREQQGNEVVCNFTRCSLSRKMVKCSRAEYHAVHAHMHRHL